MRRPGEIAGLATTSRGSVEDAAGSAVGGAPAIGGPRAGAGGVPGLGGAGRARAGRGGVAGARSPGAPGTACRRAPHATAGSVPFTNAIMTTRMHSFD